MMRVKVFLNEGPDNFFGFHNTFADEPRLRLAAEFYLPEPVGTETVYTRLNKVFEQLNVGGDLVPAEHWTEEYRAKGNRSLSVGDVVVLGEVAFSVDSFGWGQVSTEDLEKAIAAFDEKGSFYDETRAR